jgi:transposase InsO family protein
MPYTTYKEMPKIRRDAAHKVYQGWSTRKTARHFGVSQSAVVKWCKKATVRGYNEIPTQSSRPHHHPHQIPKSVERRIVEIRLKTRRTSEVVHQHLLNEGVSVSLNTVRRVIDRHGLMKKRSLHKRWHPHVDRPQVAHQGDLVQVDTIHTMLSEKKRMYTFALVDVYSRWAYAKSYERMSGKTSIKFLKEAQRHAPFRFSMLQSDHGPEFSQWFVFHVRKSHRYTRIGKPNDNAHIERFNRTLQEECLDKEPRDVKSFNCALKKYLQYYNHERLHMGIQLKTPAQLATSDSKLLD